MKNEFTQQEWDTCIKVLQVLSRDPEKSLDTHMLKGLVTKLYRRAKKENKQHRIEEQIRPLITSTELLSPQKVKKISQQQDLLKQYNKKLVLTQTILHQKYELPNDEKSFDTTASLELAGYQKCYICKTSYKKFIFSITSFVPPVLNLTIHAGSKQPI